MLRQCATTAAIRRKRLVAVMCVLHVEAQRAVPRAEKNRRLRSLRAPFFNSKNEAR